MKMYQPFKPEYMVETPFLFFTGKGGVGKTSTACATAVHLADKGKKVLLVSTDPASNLQDVLEIELSNIPKPVPTVSNLYACNINPEEAAENYREKVVGPYRDKLPESVVTSMEEQLSGACTVEIAAFDEFTDLLSNQTVVNTYDHILFDTAPTGHTLRLLQLPTAWSGFLEESTHGASCLGPLSGLAEKKEMYQTTLEALSDGNKTTLVLVTRPEASSIYEANRSAKELREIGIKNQTLIVNGLLQSHLPNDQISNSFYHRQREALKEIPESLKQAAIYSLPFVSYSLTGVDNLRNLFKAYEMPAKEILANKKEIEQSNGLSDIINDFSINNTRVILTMGKGGVGKTTVASAIAVGLVEKGHRVHLTTTDPAAHLDYMFENSSINDRLTISAIDPKTEVDAYKEEVLSQNAASLDEEGLAYLKEDLESPCTEEIALFRAFAEQIAKSEKEIVVVDTAPTGHTLLLLDSAQEYHKELSKSTGGVPESVQKLLPRLRNSKETSVVIVTLAEATPVIEAERLQNDLIRADIVPKWWIINQSLSKTDTKDPVLLGRARSEKSWIDRVKNELATNSAIIPWISEERKGYEKIKEYVVN